MLLTYMILHVYHFLYHLSPSWVHHIIDARPWNISLQDLSIPLFQATIPAAFLLVALVWGNWFVRGAWNHTKEYYISPVQSEQAQVQHKSSAEFPTSKILDNKKITQDHGKHLWQQAHQQPTFCICIIINLICQIWFLYVSRPEELIYHKNHTL